MDELPPRRRAGYRHEHSVSPYHVVHHARRNVGVLLRRFWRKVGVWRIQSGVAIYVTDCDDFALGLVGRWVGIDLLDDVSDDHEVSSSSAYAQADGLAFPDLLSAKVHAVVLAKFVSLVVL